MQKPAPPAEPTLRRVIGLGPLILNGLAVIVGAGIYVAIGAVVRRAGDAAPLSFLLAGIPACLTGLCYAELASRFPEASGSVAYVRHGFGSDRIAQAIGAALTFAIAISAASIAQGAAHYLVTVLPLPTPFLVLSMIVGFTIIASRGIGASVWLASVMGAVEIGGLLVAAATGFLHIAPEHDISWVPSTFMGWQGVFAGAFIAFFAFIGFETLVNLAEEVKNPQRTVPLAIIGSVGVSVFLYIAVTSSIILADSPDANPLLGLFAGHGATLFAAIASIAVSNGVLLQIVMLARMFYGMAGNGQLPAALHRIDPATGSPHRATLLSGGIILAVALLVPFEMLLTATNAVSLGIFALVDLALWRVQRKQPYTVGFAVPRWLPLAAASTALLLLATEILK